MNFSQRIEWFRLNSDEFIHLSNQVYLDHAANAIYMVNLTLLFNLDLEVYFLVCFLFDNKNANSNLDLSKISCLINN